MYYQNKRINLFRILTNLLIVSIIFETVAIFEYLEKNKTFKPKIFVTKNFSYKPIIDVSPKHFAYTNSNGTIELKQNSPIFNPPLVSEHSIYNSYSKVKPKKKSKPTVALNDKTKKTFKIEKINSKRGKIINRKVAENRVIHEVKKGETLWEIAKHYGLKADDIAACNNISKNTTLKVGQKLAIVTNKGFIYEVKKGDSLWKIGNMFNINYKALAFYNNLKKISLKAGTKLVIPWTKNTAEKKYALHLQNSTKFRWPCSTRRITSPFGYRTHPTLKRRIFHTGLDIGISYAPVRAALSGTVTYAGWMKGYGKIVILKHKKGYSTRYAHLSSFKVSTGQKIVRGQKIAVSGNTGITTGPHLHFEVRKYGKLVNPLTLLPR